MLGAPTQAGGNVDRSGQRWTLAALWTLSMCARSLVEKHDHMLSVGVRVQSFMKTDQETNRKYKKLN